MDTLNTFTGLSKGNVRPRDDDYYNYKRNEALCGQITREK